MVIGLVSICVLSYLLFFAERAESIYVLNDHANQVNQQVELTYKDRDYKLCPAQCLQWYDGCNWCPCLAVGKVGACTERTCESLTRPYCYSWAQRDPPNRVSTREI